MSENAINTSENSEQKSGENSITDTDTVTKVLLVDDHAVVRDGIRARFENHPDFEVVGEAVKMLNYRSSFGCYVLGNCKS